jgi:hypothetical protein
VNLLMNVNPQPAFAGGAITMVHGKTRRFRLQVLDRATGLPADITGWTSFRFLAKDHLEDLDADAVVTKTLGGGITIIQAATGLVEVLIVAADTSALDDILTRLFAELQGVDPTALPWSLWQGELDIQPTTVEASN